MQADLHVHSRYSTRPSQWFLQKIGCPESFTEPLHLYHVARHRGMTLVTITDHNQIAGALEIAHLPGTFISEEITAYFPEDQCKVHVLAYDITEAQHTDIQKARASIYDLVAYLRGNHIAHVLAHPFYSVNDRLTVEHVEKLLLLFRHFELNGDINPESNQCLKIIIGSITAAVIDRLAEKHGIDPGMAEPWRKHLVAGSDDHSSLNIARNFTRAPDAGDLAGFLFALAAGRVETEERPSSPQNVAYNLYSIAYQFYRHKLGLGGDVPHHFLLRFVDRCLRGTGESETGLLGRLHLMWRYRRIRKIQGSIPGPLIELLQKESTRLVAEEPDLFRVPEEGNRMTQCIEERWFGFLNKMSNRILIGFANHLMDHISGASLFNIFHTIGSAGGFCTLLAPYFVAFSIYNRQRLINQTVLERLGPAPSASVPLELEPACAVFAENLQAAAEALALLGDRGEGERSCVLTCEADGPGREPRLHVFAPIGVYEFEDFPEQRLVYPPVLEMLDFCYRRGIRRLHLASDGPTGLAGLFIARFLIIPFDATYSDRMLRLARGATRDSFIEDLCWKYTVWFYHQAERVFVASRACMQELAARGLAPEKMHPLRSREERAVDRRSASAAECAAAV